MNSVTMKFSEFCISTVLLISFVTLGACQEKEKVCNELYRCSRDENPVWATTDGMTCEVFRNPCLMSNENCNRRNEGEPEAEVIEKEECQELCPENCDKIFDPICGEYKDEQRFFSNICVMRNHICETGKTFEVFSEGPCPGQTFEEDELD